MLKNETDQRRMTDLATAASNFANHLSTEATFLTGEGRFEFAGRLLVLEKLAKAFEADVRAAMPREAPAAPVKRKGSRAICPAGGRHRYGAANAEGVKTCIGCGAVKRPKATP